MSQILDLFQQLFEGKEITLSFPSPKDFTAFYSQLRVTKSRQDSKFKSLFDESLFDGKVIRVEKLSSGTYKFWLDKPKEVSTTSFTIVSISPTHHATEK